MLFSGAKFLYNQAEKLAVLNCYNKVEKMQNDIGNYTDEQIIHTMRTFEFEVFNDIYNTPKLYHPRIVKCNKIAFTKRAAERLWQNNRSFPQVIVNRFEQYPKEILKNALIEPDFRDRLSDTVKSTVKILLNN